MLDALRLDLRAAWRSLHARPGLTVAALASLALGIGANTTVFTWVDRVLLRPLPGVDDPERLVAIEAHSPSQPILSFSYPDYLELRGARTLAGVTASDDVEIALAEDRTSPQRVWAVLVTGNHFPVVGGRALLGRLLTPEDDAPGAAPALVVSERLWRSRWDGSPAALGRSVRVSGQAFTLVGVVAAPFAGTRSGLAYDAWLPMAHQPRVAPGGDRLGRRGDHWLSLMGRLGPGVSLAQAQAELGAMGQRLAQAYPDDDGQMSIALYPPWKAPRTAAGLLGPVLGLLTGFVALVLLVTCANVTGLLLARAVERRREIAVRLALGASQGALLRQMLVESAALGVLGGALGAGLARWGTLAMTALAPPTNYPIALPEGVDLRSLAFTFGVSLLASLLFGMAPALQSLRPQLVGALRDEAGSVGGAHRARLRRVLVGGQVALSLVLLVAAALLVRGLHRASALEPGFQPRGVLMAGFDLFPAGHAPEQGREVLARLLGRVRALPGVESATLDSRVPLTFGGTSSFSGLEIDGRPPAPGEDAWAAYDNVGPSYFATLRIPLASGRDFTDLDRHDSAPVAVVNETMARRYWPEGQALGGRVRVGGNWHTVVGISRDIAYRQLGEQPFPLLYLPIQQRYRSSAWLQVRTSGDPRDLAASVRAAVAAVDPGLPLSGVDTLEAHTGAATFATRLAATLLGVFGAGALLLSGVGLFGLLGHAVAQRRREIGLRVVLGASRSDVMGLVVGSAMRVVGLGTLCGLALSVPAARALAGLAFGVRPLDPLAVGGALLLTVAVALVACALPARRALGVEPARALRAE